jgi:hypothetical protein
VAQRAGETRLPEEPLDHVGVSGAKRGELLERDEAVEVGLAREVHHGHPAAADLTHDLVPPDRAGDLHAHAQTVDQ